MAQSGAQLELTVNLAVAFTFLLLAYWLYTSVSDFGGYVAIFLALLFVVRGVLEYQNAM